MEKIREKLSLVPDYRHSSYIGHKLSDVLIIIMVAVLCGLDQLNDLVIYANEKADFFKLHFDIAKIPLNSRIFNLRI